MSKAATSVVSPKTKQPQAHSSDLSELKQSVETLAEEEGKTPLEMISQLQAATVATSNEQLLDDLCELKWEYI
jgi:hypothetical protein